jgi:serine O-acetyltransferase
MYSARTSPRQVWTDWVRDVHRFTYYGGRPVEGFRGRLTVVREFLANQGLQAVALYRFAQFGKVLRGNPRTFLLGALVALVYPVLSRLNDIVTGVSISPEAKIGPGLYIAHFGGVIIGPVTVGENCNIGHGVTLGGSGRTADPDRPAVGDRVVLATGSKILGGVSIGDDVLVGPNTVVTRSVPARSTIFGNPGRVVSDGGSFGYLAYAGFESDPARTAALRTGTAAPPGSTC